MAHSTTIRTKSLPAGYLILYSDALILLIEFSLSPHDQTYEGSYNNLYHYYPAEDFSQDPIVISTRQHKLCEPIATESVKAWLFPVNGNSPLLITMSCDVFLDGADMANDTTFWWTYQRHQAAGLEKYLPKDVKAVRLSREASAGDREQAKLEVISGWYAHTPPEVPINKCIQRLSVGTSAQKWYGNVLVFAFKDHGVETKFDDCSLDDLRFLVRFFKSCTGVKSEHQARVPSWIAREPVDRIMEKRDGMLEW